MWWYPDWQSYGICDDTLTDRVTVYVMIHWLTELRYMWYPDWQSYGICDDTLTNKITVNISHRWGVTILKEFPRTQTAICPIDFGIIHEADQKRKDSGALSVRMALVHTNGAAEYMWAVHITCGAVHITCGRYISHVGGNITCVRYISHVCGTYHTWAVHITCGWWIY
jgi:hypothetical protein